MILNNWTPANLTALTQGVVGTAYANSVMVDVSLNGGMIYPSINITGYTTTFAIPGLTLNTSTIFPLLILNAQPPIPITFNISGTPLSPPNPLDAPINYPFTITLESDDDIFQEPNPINYSLIINPNPNSPKRRRGRIAGVLCAKDVDGNFLNFRGTNYQRLKQGECIFVPVTRRRK